MVGGMKGGDRMFGDLGWKTIVGALIIGAGEVVTALGYPELGIAIKGVGTSLFGIGAAHKIVKLTRAAGTK